MFGAIASIGTSLWSGHKADKARKKAQRENERRYAQAMKIYDKVAKLYRPGGSYADALRMKVKEAGQIAQGKDTMRAIQTGLAGTTYGGQVATRYAKTTGNEAMLSLEDYLTDKYAQALKAKAGLIIGRDDVGPSYGDVVSAYSGVGSGISTLFKGLTEYFSKKKGSKVAMNDKDTTIPSQRIVV